MSMLCRPANNGAYLYLQTKFKPKKRRIQKPILYIFKIKENTAKENIEKNIIIYNNIMPEPQLFELVAKSILNVYRLDITKAEKKKMIEYVLKNINKKKFINYMKKEISRFASDLVHENSRFMIWFTKNSYWYNTNTLRDIIYNEVIPLLLDFFSTESWHKNYHLLLYDKPFSKNDHDKVSSCIELIEFIASRLIKHDKVKQFISNLSACINSQDEKESYECHSFIGRVYYAFHKFIDIIFEYFIYAFGGGKDIVYFYKYNKFLAKKMKTVNSGEIINYSKRLTKKDGFFKIVGKASKNVVIFKEIIFEYSNNTNAFIISSPKQAITFFTGLFLNKIPLKLEEWEVKIKKNIKAKKITKKRSVYVPRLESCTHYIIRDYSTNHKMLKLKVDLEGKLDQIEIYLTPFHVFLKTLDFFEVEINEQYIWMIWQCIILFFKLHQQ